MNKRKIKRKEIWSDSWFFLRIIVLFLVCFLIPEGEQLVVRVLLWNVLILRCALKWGAKLPFGGESL